MLRLQYGIEVECLSSVSRLALSKKLKEAFRFNVKDSNTFSWEGHCSKDTIFLTEDYSIYTKRGDYELVSKRRGIDQGELDLEAIEIVFPIVSEARLFKIFQILEEDFFKPGILHINSSCGMHVNTSFVSNTIHRRVDIARLAVAFDTKHWQKVFNRERCMYCRQLITQKDIDMAYKKSEGESRVMLMHLYMRLKRKEDKYKAINTSNFDWENGGRIEFRVAGGPKVMNSKLMIKHTMAINEAMHEALKAQSNKLTRRLNKLLAA
jgi:hypothetical protein